MSRNLGQIEIGGYNRVGQKPEVALEGYFGADGAPASRLFISADGYLDEVTLVEASDGAVYAQYGLTEVWGNWSPSDDLIFLDGSEVAGADEEVSMRGAGLLGGSSLLGLGGAGAAALGPQP
jgi:hypothetical protein